MFGFQQKKQFLLFILTGIFLCIFLHLEQTFWCRCFFRECCFHFFCNKPVDLSQHLLYLIFIVHILPITFFGQLFVNIYQHHHKSLQDDSIETKKKWNGYHKILKWFKFEFMQLSLSIKLCYVIHSLMVLLEVTKYNVFILKWPHCCDTQRRFELLAGNFDIVQICSSTISPKFCCVHILNLGMLIKQSVLLLK